MIVSGFTIPGVTYDSYSQSVGVALLDGTIIISVLAILAQPRLTAAAKLFANYGSKWPQDQLLGQPIFCLVHPCCQYMVMVSVCWHRN